jgi:hypothetical protein
VSETATITLGGKPYTITKLEGEAAVRWQRALAEFEKELGYDPVKFARLLLALERKRQRRLKP